MELKIKTDCSEIDWSTIAESLKKVGMAYHEPEVHKRAFEASYTTVFIYEGSQLIGFGRAISDGEYQGQFMMLLFCQKLKEWALERS
jgi:hypothetical protein